MNTKRKFIRKGSDEAIVVIEVDAEDSFETLSSSAQVTYDLSNGDAVLLTIDRQYLDPADIDELIEFLKVAKAHIA